MSFDRLKTLPESLGLGPSSTRGRRALASVAVTLAPGPVDRRQLPPITGRLADPSGVEFEAQGPGIVYEPYHGVEKPSVTIFYPNGPEITYQFGRFGRVRKFSDDRRTSHRLTPVDAAMLEAAASATITLKAQRDYRVEQAVLEKGVLQEIPAIDKAIAYRLAFSNAGGSTSQPDEAYATLTVPLFNPNPKEPYALLSQGFKPGENPATHRFSVIRQIEGGACEAFAFTIEKYGKFRDQLGQVTCIKKASDLPDAEFAKLSRERAAELIASGKPTPYTASDAQFLASLGKWIEHPTISGEFGVGFNTDRFKTTAFKKTSPSSSIYAVVTNDPRRGTVFTVSETTASASLDRPAEIPEMITMLKTLAQTLPNLETNPWLALEATKVRHLLSGAQTTVRALLEEKGGRTVTDHVGSQIDLALLESTAKWLDEVVSNAIARRILNSTFS